MIIEVYNGIYVGNEADLDEFKEGRPEHAIIHACKEPFHRQAVGYTGRGAPKNHPEYLVAIRDNELCLNLVDAPKPEFIPRECFIAAAEFIDELSEVDDAYPVFIHCNQGKSRSVGIAMYYLAGLGVLSDNFETAMEEMQELYPYMELGEGVMGALDSWWESI